METLLNLVWLAVTLVGVWLWRFRWTASRSDRRGRGVSEAVAVVCLLALLFPVISLTDDLHPEIMIAECASAKRTLTLLVAAGPHASHPLSNAAHQTAVAILVANPQRIELISTSLDFSTRHLPSIFLSSVPLGRSPPTLI